MCLGMGEGEKKFQEASGNGNHEAAWEGREGKALQTRPYSPFQRPSLTQGSLADVRAGGPSNNKLRVIADLLGTRPTECCQAARHMFLGLGHLHSQWVHFLPPSPRESFAVRDRLPWGLSHTPSPWNPNAPHCLQPTLSRYFLGPQQHGVLPLRPLWGPFILRGQPRQPLQPLSSVLHASSFVFMGFLSHPVLSCFTSYHISSLIATSSTKPSFTVQPLLISEILSPRALVLCSPVFDCAASSGDGACVQGKRI